MRKKFLIFSAVSFFLAFFTDAFTYILYHYYTVDGFGTVFQSEACKPFITLLFGILGTFFLFSGITGLLIAFIFFKNE